MQPENFDTDAPQLWSEKIEQQILGTLLVDFDADIMGEIDPGWFRLVKHQQIAKILRRRPDAAGNLEAIGDELKRAGELENAGGYGYLARLTASYAGRYAIQEHVKRLADYASRRRMIELASELARRAYNLQVEVGQTVGDIYSGLDSLALSTGEAAEHWKGALNRLYNYVEQRKDNPQDVYGVSVGLTDFDHLTGGLQYGETTLIAGAPGMGKSILAMQLGLMAVIEGRQAGVAIYSLEMRELQLMLRCISALAKIPTHRLKSGKMQPDDWILFAQTVGDAESLPVYVYPRAELTTDQLRSDLKRLRARYGVKIFVLDYLHLMTDELKNQNDVERSGYLSRKISAIAKDLGMIGITVDSVTKEGMGSNGNGFEPSMKILRGSGQLMHDADNVFYLSQSQAAPDFRDLYLLKGREITASGKAKITLRKNPEYPWFENAVTKQLVAEMLR